LQYFQLFIPTLNLPRNSDLNQIRAPDRAAHDWYRFVLSFPPHLVREYLEKFGMTAEQRVLDPFCGTGTTIVECKKRGIPGIGIEANPMAWFAGTVKLDWTIDPDHLLSHAQQMADMTQEILQQQQPLKTLSAERSQLLLKNSISDQPLHKTLVLLEQLNHKNASIYQPYEQLALAKALVYSISNLKFLPEVSVGKPKPDAPVVELWLAAVTDIVQDLRYLQTLPTHEARIHRGDARQLGTFLAPHSIDAVITSPPYPNEKDYTRTTRLESVLLGFIENKADLRTLKQGLLRSNSRAVYRGDNDDRWVADHPEIQRIAAEIEARRLRLGKTSGFERAYSRATKLYFGGMAKHLADLRPALRPGAQLAYVVGDQASYLRVMIRTGKLLASLAESLGYEVDRVDLFRTRMATATREQLREEVVVLRWRG
jgi:hypothetical protein